MNAQSAILFFPSIFTFLSIYLLWYKILDITGFLGAWDSLFVFLGIILLEIFCSLLIISMFFALLYAVEKPEAWIELLIVVAELLILFFLPWYLMSYRLF